MYAVLPLGAFVFNKASEVLAIIDHLALADHVSWRLVASRAGTAEGVVSFSVTGFSFTRRKKTEK